MFTIKVAMGDGDPFFDPEHTPLDIKLLIDIGLVTVVIIQNPAPEIVGRVFGVEYFRGFFQIPESFTVIRNMGHSHQVFDFLL